MARKPSHSFVKKIKNKNLLVGKYNIIIAIKSYICNKIAVAEKYRPIYERQAKENQSKYYGNQYDNKNGLTEKLPQVQKDRNPTTDKKLSDIAGVSEKTYRMGAKVLNSDNEELKKEVLSGETSISAAYKTLQNEKKKTQPSDNQTWKN